MSRFHVTNDGEVKPCRDRTGRCPYLSEDNRHFESKNDAEAAAQRFLTENHSSLPEAVSKIQKTSRSRPFAKDYLDPENPEHKKFFEEDYFDKRYSEHKRLLETYKNKDGNIPLRLEPQDTLKWKDWKKRNPGLALTPDPDTPKQMSIYRAGSLEPAVLEGEVAFFSDEGDYHRPEDASPRHGSLFAASDGAGLSRWLKANSRTYKDSETFTPREIKVDPNKVRVYHIRDWERFSNQDGKTPPHDYWNSGMLLSRFKKAADEEDWDETEWEILVPPEAIISSKKMSEKSATELIKPEDAYEQQELKRIFKTLRNSRKTS